MVSLLGSFAVFYLRDVCLWMCVCVCVCVCVPYRIVQAVLRNEFEEDDTILVVAAPDNHTATAKAGDGNYRSGLLLIKAPKPTQHDTQPSDTTHATDTTAADAGGEADTPAPLQKKMVNGVGSDSLVANGHHHVLGADSGNDGDADSTN